MRIPVTLADLELGRITKIARALGKAWPLGRQGLSAAQNLLSSFLGYRDLHDLQACATPSVPWPVAKTSRTEIANAVAWRMHRRHGIDLSSAVELVGRLHLHTLDADRCTIEARMAGTVANFRGSPSRLVMVDEAWPLLDPGYGWNTLTPDLLAAGVPGFEHAMLPDGRIFVWDALDELCRYLPADLADQLLAEDRYAGLSRDAAAAAFFLNEIYPQACLPAVDAHKDWPVRPDGFRLAWLFGADGQCLGRVIENTTLGAVLPAVFEQESDEAFAALARVMAGLPVDAGAPVSDIEASGGRPVYLGKYRCDGTLQRELTIAKPYPLPDESAPQEAAGRMPPDALERLTGITLHAAGGRKVLAGPTFMERGQAYLRFRSWMGPADVPAILAAGMPRTRTEPPADAPEGPVPAISASTSKAAAEAWGARLATAGTAIYGEEGAARLMQLAARFSAPATFADYCERGIASALPLRYEEDTEDDPDLVCEHREARRQMARLGRQAKASLTGLDGFSDEAVGWMVLTSCGESPGGRYAGLCNAPEPGAWRDIRDFWLTVVLLHASAASGGDCFPCERPHLQSLLIASHEAAVSGMSPEDFLRLYTGLRGFSEHAERERQDQEEIAKWRQRWAAQGAIRRGGAFLYCGKVVPVKRPQAFPDHWLTAGRKVSHPVTQSAADLDSDAVAALAAYRPQ